MQPGADGGDTRDRTELALRSGFRSRCDRSEINRSECDQVLGRWHNSKRLTDTQRHSDATIRIRTTRRHALHATPVSSGADATRPLKHGTRVQTLKAATPGLLNRGTTQATRHRHTRYRQQQRRMTATQETTAIGPFSISSSGLVQDSLVQVSLVSRQAWFQVQVQSQKEGSRSRGTRGPGG